MDNYNGKNSLIQNGLCPWEHKQPCLGGFYRVSPPAARCVDGGMIVTAGGAVSLRIRTEQVSTVPTELTHRCHIVMNWPGLQMHARCLEVSRSC